MMWKLQEMLPKSGNILFKLTLLLIFSSGKQKIKTMQRKYVNKLDKLLYLIFAFLQFGYGVKKNVTK